ncbi:hypothetical protein IP86_07265, partial [Rhodopseudomonas sp. AAP120]
IHVFAAPQGVDARDKRGHDGEEGREIIGPLLLVEARQPFQRHCVLILRSPAQPGVSKDGHGCARHMVRDGAPRLLTMRLCLVRSPGLLDRPAADRKGG